MHRLGDSNGLGIMKSENVVGEKLQTRHSESEVCAIPPARHNVQLDSTR